MKKILIYLLLAGIFAGCSSKKLLKKDAYSALYREKPLSVLVLPPINRSVKVEAKEAFYSSLSAPIAQRGYYTLPPLLAMDILKEESVYDSELFLGQSTKKIGEVFGTDAVLFTIIHSWKKSSIGQCIRVKIEYQMISTATDEMLFHRTGDITVSTSVNTGNVIGNIVAGIVVTALSKEIIAGQRCNLYTFSDLPAGKYHASFGADGEKKAQPKEFKATVRK